MEAQITDFLFHCIQIYERFMSNWQHFHMDISGIVNTFITHTVFLVYKKVTRQKTSI